MPVSITLCLQAKTRLHKHPLSSAISRLKLFDSFEMPDRILVTTTIKRSEAKPTAQRSLGSGNKFSNPAGHGFIDADSGVGQWYMTFYRFPTSSSIEKS
jgi:hypothetical protein